VGRGGGVREVGAAESGGDVYAGGRGAGGGGEAELADEAGRLNEDPYGEGWICVVELDGEAPGDLLDAEAYRALTEG